MIIDRKNTHFLAFVSTFLLIIALCKLFVFNFVVGHGNSMQPTLSDNSVMMINRMYYGIKMPHGKDWLYQRRTPRPGEVVIVKNPDRHDSSEWLIKRVVASGGDVVRVEGERIFVNGVALETKTGQKYSNGYQEFLVNVFGHSHTVLLKENSQKLSPLIVTWHIPKGYVFVVGDNRFKSLDSRSFGPVKEEDVVGKVINKWSTYKFVGVDES